MQVRAQEGTALIERPRSRFLLREFNDLHLNRPKGIWTWVADGFAGLLLLLTAYAFCAAALATLGGAVFKTPEQASAIGWLSSMVMAALGGCWWPSEIVPRWLRTASHVFPTAWAMDAFHALISFGRGMEAVLLPAAVLVGFGVVFATVGARRLRVEGV